MKKFYINHFQTHQMLSTKALLAHDVQVMWKSLAKVQHPLTDQFKTIPLTFILPESFTQLVRYAETLADKCKFNQTRSYRSRVIPVNSLKMCLHAAPRAPAAPSTQSSQRSKRRPRK